MSIPVGNDEYNQLAATIAFGTPPPPLPDPFSLLAGQLHPLDASLREFVGNEHPVIMRAAQHFVEIAGRRFHPTLVLLAASAATGGKPPTAQQKQLAEITELIHAAILLHDDVDDLSDARRGSKAAHRMYGNKVAVLAGDFLLARASVLLSCLESVQTVELLATVIEQMAQGELMPVKVPRNVHIAMDQYLSKAYRKNASIISLSCQASVLLGGQASHVEAALHTYGHHLGMTHYIVDGMLDFPGYCPSDVGRRDVSGMQLGIPAAPMCFAADAFPEMLAIVRRRFSKEGDAHAFAELIGRSDGVTQAQDLATAHARKAVEALQILEPSIARDALLCLCFEAMNRKAFEMDASKAALWG